MEQVRIEQTMRNSQLNLRNLTVFLESEREKERARIAREIHDELGQMLSLLRIQIDTLQKQIVNGHNELNIQVESLGDLVDKTIVTVQRIATDLRPQILDHLGLKTAIEWHAQDFQKRTGIKCHLSITYEEISIRKDAATALFRIFQETLTNVVRHAGAKNVEISFEKKGDNLILILKDDGKGITEEQINDAKSIGIVGIRERARLFDGSIKIEGSRAKGTTVSVSIPLVKITDIV